MEEIRKEIESLKRKTFYTWILVLVILINIVFSSITQVRQYCTIMDYYQKTIELNDDLNQELQDANRLVEEILSTVQ